ncbi:hypothetical protein [Pseudorhodoferax sp. Leaf267]|uniref:hypothetical protein n=1 Tax=Pseudorhodoferax sp. Leaf267 TaxID=1736316 RepID=UPI0012E2495E|nr:hypothetical protein [Pseudorhodoferax sp. Leaf267]
MTVQCRAHRVDRGRDAGHAQSGLTNWVRADAEGQLAMASDGQATTPTVSARLKAQVAWLTIERDIEEKSRGLLCVVRAARYAWIFSMKWRWPITPMCQVLRISASGYFRLNACTPGTKHGECRRHNNYA